MRYIVKSRQGTPIARWHSLMDCQLYLIQVSHGQAHSIDWSIIGDHEIAGYRRAPFNDTKPIVYIEIQDGDWTKGQLGPLQEESELPGRKLATTG